MMSTGALTVVVLLVALGVILLAGGLVIFAWRRSSPARRDHEERVARAGGPRGEGFIFFIARKIESPPTTPRSPDQQHQHRSPDEGAGPRRRW